MRIIHILNHTEQANGHVCAMVDLACTQAKSGHEVYVCSRGGNFDALLEANGVKHIKINQDRKIPNLPRALYKIYGMLRDVRPDIVHAHMVTSALFVAVLRPFMDFRSVTTVHNEFQRSAILMRFADRVIAVSEAVRQSMLRRGISGAKLKTVLNGTIGSPRHPRPAPPALDLPRPAIVFVGGLHPRKGVDYLIRAFASVLAAHPKAHLYLIGDGPCKKEYEALAKGISETNITFCGYLDDPRPHLLGSDIFVLFSDADPAPLVIAEAREAGCAVIASNVDGIPELLDNGVAGILVPPKQPETLAREVMKLLENPAYLAEMREKSLRNVSRFTVERVANETDRIYQELLSA